MSNEISRVNLHELHLSDCQHVGGNLSSLLSNSLPSLHILTLRKCNLSSFDLRYLALANAEGKLPMLKCLDISLNRGDLEDFFANFCLWNELMSLNILHTFEMCDRNASPRSCFKALQHLSTSDQTLYVLMDRQKIGSPSKAYTFSCKMKK